jgi:hypothetical protein
MALLEIIFQYPFLVDTVSFTKPQIGKRQRVNPIEFTVRGITGTELQTGVSTVLELELGIPCRGIDFL